MPLGSCQPTTASRRTQQNAVAGPIPLFVDGGARHSLSVGGQSATPTCHKTRWRDALGEASRAEATSESSAYQFARNSLLVTASHSVGRSEGGAESTRRTISMASCNKPFCCNVPCDQMPPNRSNSKMRTSVTPTASTADSAKRRAIVSCNHIGTVKRAPFRSKSYVPRQLGW
jgi:hypothetical protein